MCLLHSIKQPQLHRFGSTCLNVSRAETISKEEERARAQIIKKKSGDRDRDRGEREKEGTGSKIRDSRQKKNVLNSLRRYSSHATKGQSPLLSFLLFFVHSFFLFLVSISHIVPFYAAYIRNCWHHTTKRSTTVGSKSIAEYKQKQTSLRQLATISLTPYRLIDEMGRKRRKALSFLGVPRQDEAALVYCCCCCRCCCHPEP